MVPSKSNRVFNHIWCPPYCWLLTILTLSTHGSRSNSKNSTRLLLWKKPSFSTHDCGSFHFIIICICRNKFDLVHVRGQDRLLKIVSLLLETPLLLSIISLTRHLLPRDYNLYMPQPMNKRDIKIRKSTRFNSQCLSHPHPRRLRILESLFMGPKFWDPLKETVLLLV